MPINGGEQALEDARAESTMEVVATSLPLKPQPRAGELESTPSKWPQGWRPYAVLISGFLMMSCSWGLIMSYGVFFELYDEQLLPNATDLQLSLIGGTQSFLVLLLSIVVGRLLDAQQHGWILGTGVFYLVLGIFCLSFATQQVGLVWLTSGLITSLGMTCFFMYSSHNAIRWFPSNAYFATGVTSAGAGFGGVIYPPIISSLISKFGVSTGIQVLAGITSGVVVVASVLGFPKFTDRKPAIGSILKAKTWMSTSALKSKSYMLFCTSMWFAFAGYYPLSYHVAEWAEPKREKNGFSTYWFIAILNGGCVGRISTGIVASRWENPIPIQAATNLLAALVVMVFWPLSSNEASVTAFCVLLGILIGAMFGLPVSAIASIIPREHRNSLGAWTGMMWTSCAPFSMIGSLIGGALRQQYGLNVIGFWTGLNFIASSVLLFFALRGTFTKTEDIDTEIVPLEHFATPRTPGIPAEA